jgi:hypothetical protein
MRKLSEKYGPARMKTLRASRVDYYTQHDVKTWRDHLGSLLGANPTKLKWSFVNLAGVAGPTGKRKGAMHSVNYAACVAAAGACQELEFDHFIQSSTQATNAERAGQVPYSRGKAMADFSLSQITDMPGE